MSGYADTIERGTVKPKQDEKSQFLNPDEIQDTVRSVLRDYVEELGGNAASCHFDIDDEALLVRCLSNPQIQMIVGRSGDWETAQRLLSNKPPFADDEVDTSELRGRRDKIHMAHIDSTLTTGLSEKVEGWDAAEFLTRVQAQLAAKDKERSVGSIL